MDFQKAFDAGFDAIKGYVDRSFATISKRIKALEDRTSEPGADGKDGAPGIQGERGPDGIGLSDAAILREGDLLLTFTDGRTKSLGIVIGKDGRDGADGKPGADGERGPEGPVGRAGTDGKDGAPGAQGKDGSSVAVDDVLPTLKAHVDEFLATIPAPANGKDGEQGPQGEKGGPGDPGERGPQGEVGKDGAPGEKGVDGAPGKDGRSAVKFLVDQGGELVGTFSDGTVERLGVVKGSDGKNGAPGRDGKDGRDGVDGAAGRDGADGFGFDDLDFEHDGARGFSFKFVRGDKVKTFNFTVPAMIYRGVYASTGEYERGDVVTFGGSTWHCNDNTADKPDGVNKAWTLVVKKGRDGKDGVAGEKGERGAEGRPGRDLTQLGADGAKW